MNKKEIEDLIKSGDIIITTKQAIKDAVKQSIDHLYKDDGSFDNNRYANSRAFDPISKSDIDDIGDEIIDYITT